ncbi:MAG: hypothetical protein E7451_05805 [Ruminococcaceae bacterium]|nr:hypothetical protein [Oscillospiraceae bacterium]
MNRKLPYLQWLRCFAAIAVVLMHLCAQSWYAAAPESGAWQILNIWEALVRWPVPVFVMISGALFLGAERPMGRYIRRVLIALVFWSGIYTLVSGKTGMAAVTEFLCGHYHLWYLYFLCGLYLIAPFLGKLARDEALCTRFLVISLIFGNVLPRIPELVHLFSGELGALADAFYGRIKISFCLGYVFQFLLGYRLSLWEPGKTQRRTIYALGILGGLVTVVGTAALSRWKGAPVQLLYEPQSLHISAMAAAIFVFAKQHLTRLPKVVDSLARCSFGIYLSHALLIEELARHGVDALTWDPLWAVPVLTITVTAVCWAGTALLRRLPVIGKTIT